ncbi:MAG: T9SS type A sorting domain-containing protein [Chitinophagaceae bacterium]|nr:T9SS type A sorting domain-containing protein [Chitinophagaceae bacterium]MCW5905626.1 T9SS type A sorting domain-containing protein [Chitinophagaceae bacterium]
MTKRFLLTVAILLQITCLFSQALYQVDNEEKAVNATLIIEGKVVDKVSFWNETQTMIYTSNKIKVYKVFKGEINTDYIEVITEGGTIGEYAVHASDLLELVNEQEGVFFCFPNIKARKSPTTNKVLFDVYSSSQGFWIYNLYENKATDPFNTYQGITTTVYPLLKQLTGQDYVVKDPTFNVEGQKQAQQTQAQKVLFPSITSFSPSTVHGGAMRDAVNNVLTITGSGFGTFTGTAAVLFNDGNTSPGTDYPVAANDAQLSPLIISWTDTEIKVKVPARASSGFFKVRDQSGSIAYSPDYLNVFFGIINFTTQSGGIYHTKEFNLMNMDGIGGYTIYYSSSTAGNGVNFDGSTAKLAFQRALNTWKEIAGFNITEGGSTVNQAVSSGAVCTIMYDNQNTGNNPLPSGVLAVCYSYPEVCNSNVANIQGRRKKFDIVVRNNAVSQGSTSFNNGPCPSLSSIGVNTNSPIDLETVLLHELGHAIGLAHVNSGPMGAGLGNTNPGSVMHYAISGSNRRTSPDASPKAGANYSIQPQSNSYGTCTSLTEMIPLTTIAEPKDDCPLSFPTSATPNPTTVSFDMVHSTSNVKVDPELTQIRCDAVGTAITNNTYYVVKTNDNAGSATLSIMVSGYATSPAALANCTHSTLPASGFRLSVYKVNSCPTASSFPNPVACRTFAGNGPIADITGLQANTTYLIYIGAIENTKAVFDLTFSGSALLPIKLSSFTGATKSDFNNLDWVVEQVINVDKIVIERSSNGTEFNAIGEIKGNEAYLKKGNFKDYKPYIISYYRLKIINTDGSAEYSKTIVLKRNDKVLFTVNPNPATTYSEIQISSEIKGKYSLMIYNINGQAIYKKDIIINPGINSHKINTAAFAKGVYRIVLFNEQNTNAHSNTLIVQ